MRRQDTAARRFDSAIVAPDAAPQYITFVRVAYKMPRSLSRRLRISEGLPRRYPSCNRPGCLLVTDPPLI